MSEEEKKPKTFAAKLKDAIEHGKTLSMAIVLVLSTGMGVYHFFAPEKEARASYNTLKPVVENTANEIQRLQIRLDYAEKMMLMNCSKSDTKADAAIVPTPAIQPVPRAPVIRPGIRIDDLDVSANNSPVRLPDAPWNVQQE